MAALTSSAVAPLRVRASAPTGRKVRTRPAQACDARCGSRTAALTPAAPVRVLAPQTQAVSVRAALPKVAESARLALAGAAAVLVLSTAAVQPAMANSCGSMPTGAWSQNAARLTQTYLR